MQRMGAARGQACGARGVRGVLAGLFVVSLAALFVSNAALLFDADCSSADDVSALRVQLSALKASSTAQLQLAQAELRASEALRAHLETSKAEAVPSRLSQRLSQRESQKPSQKQEAAPAGPQRRTHLAPKDVARAELLVRGQGRTKWSEGMDAGGWEWRHGEELDWTPEELASAQGFEDSACTILDTCCVGAMTGGSPRWRPGRCLANTALFEEEPRAPFQQRWAVELGVRGYAGGEPALGVLDVLHSMPDGLRVMLMGDSVMLQYFDNFLCGALRQSSAGVRSKKTWARIGHIRNGESGTRTRREATLFVREDAEDGKSAKKSRDTTVVHHEDWGFNDLSIKEGCTGVDVLVLNFGIHWNDRGKYERDMAKLPALLRKHCSGVRKIFMGSTAQHHLTDGGYWVQHGVQEKTLDYMARGGFPEAHMSIVRDKPNGVGGCAKDRFRDGPDWRDATALATLQQAFGDVRLPTVARGRERMCRPVEDPGETVWFIPVADRMAPLYSQHDTDCTHYCLNPNVFDAQHDGLARTMADALGTCDEVNRRRGAQGWGDELLYSDIGSRKKPGKSNEPGPNFQIEEFRNCSTNDVYNCCNTKYMYRCKPV